METSRSKNKQLLINIVAQVLSFGVNVGIGFFLTPYIIKTVGSTAYGFVGLANNFVNYVQILTTALNSMAGRFIAISYYKDDIEDVKKYFSSVLYANVIMSLVLSIPLTLILCFLNKLVNVPNDILSDVTILWALLFGSMLISIVGCIYNNAAYVKNRLELVSMRTIESNILKALLLIGTFTLLVPRVWYVGLASFICGLYIIVVNMYYTKKLMPQVEIRRKYFDFGKVKELIASGIWNSVSQLGNVLSTGLDLLITNLFVGAGPMGVVSISKTLPTYIQSLFITVASVFAPQLTISYAQDDKEDMEKQLLLSMKLMGLLASIPIAVILAYGVEFYQLWTPTQDGKVLMLLTCAAVLEYPISLLVYPLQNVFATTNKVKTLSLTTIAFALASCLTVLIIVPNVEDEFLKMMIVVGTSCLYNIIKNLLFIPRQCSKILEIKSRGFYAILTKSVLTTVVLSIGALCMKTVFKVHSWMQLICAVIIIAGVGLGMNLMVLLDKSERESLLKRVKSKLGR